MQFSFDMVIRALVFAILAILLYGAYPVLTSPAVVYFFVATLIFLIGLGVALSVGATLNWLSQYWLNYRERMINLEGLSVTVYGKRRFFEDDRVVIGSISADSVTSHNPYSRSQRELGPGTEMEPLELQEPRPRLMDALNHCDTILYVGGRRRGKTTNMMRVMESRADLEQAIIFDTHASPSKWPGAAKVIGSEIDITEAERFENIWTQMQGLIRFKNKRLDQFRKGLTPEAGFSPRITIYIDEFTHIPSKLKQYGYELGDFTQEILTEGAKVNFYFVWGVHSFRKKALGLEGSMDLTECFDAVVHLVKEKGHFYAEISWTGDQNTDGKQYEPADPYPQYMITSGSDIFEPKIDFEGPESLILDQTEVIDLAEEPEPEPERDSDGWPIIAEGTYRQRLEKFAQYMTDFGFDITALGKAEVLDHLSINRNGANYKMWRDIVSDHAFADDDHEH